MRIAFLSIAANAVLLACGGDDSPGPSPAGHLAFTVQPSTTTAGQVMSPAVQVSVQDAAGNPVVRSGVTITLRLSDPDAMLNGQTIRTGSNGVAVFSDLSISKPGSSFSLTAAASGMDGATSSEFAVLPGPAPAGHLAFNVQPSTIVAGQVMTPAVQVSGQDAAGNQLTAAVTLHLHGSTGAVPLNGQTTRAATNGVAVFSDLSITKSASGYLLRATAAGMDDGISSEFAVLPGPATAFAIGGGNNQVASPGSPVLNRPKVHVVDGFGNGVAGVRVAFEVASGGGTVEGAQASTDAQGFALVGSWRLGTSPGPNTLRATAGTLTGSPVIFTATAVPLPTAITIEVHNDFFHSVRNGSGYNGHGYANQPRDTIAVGGTVTWVWMGQNHNVEQVSPAPRASLTGNHDAPFTLGPITFFSPGTVRYRCTNHSGYYDNDGMAGTILVR